MRWIGQRAVHLEEAGLTDHYLAGKRRYDKNLSVEKPGNPRRKCFNAIEGLQAGFLNLRPKYHGIAEPYGTRAEHVIQLAIPFREIRMCHDVPNLIDK